MNCPAGRNEIGLNRNVVQRNLPPGLDILSMLGHERSPSPGECDCCAGAEMAVEPPDPLVPSEQILQAAKDLDRAWPDEFVGVEPTSARHCNAAFIGSSHLQALVRRSQRDLDCHRRSIFQTVVNQNILAEKERRLVYSQAGLEVCEPEAVPLLMRADIRRRCRSGTMATRQTALDRYAKWDVS